MKSRGGSGDAPRTVAVCRLLAADNDPMVAKGLSWALRSLAPVAPTAVSDFLAAHDHTLPSLVRREVRNKLDTGRKSGGRR